MRQVGEEVQVGPVVVVEVVLAVASDPVADLEVVVGRVGNEGLVMLVRVFIISSFRSVFLNVILIEFKFSNGLEKD